MSRSARILAGLFFVQLAAIVLFGLLEGGTRYWLAERAPPATFRRFASMEQLSLASTDSTSKRYVPHRYIGYRLNPGFTSGGTHHNSDGFRGPEIPRPKPADEFRIVCVGGSTTYTSEVPNDALTYPAHMEKAFREMANVPVRVINAGCGGWTTWESLVNLELGLLDLEPDLIVVYHAINDIHPRLVWPPDRYLGDASGYRGPVTEATFTPALWEHSSFLRTALITLDLAEPHAYATIERRLMDESAPSSYSDVFRGQQRAGTYPGGVFTRVDAQRMLATNDPRYFQRNLESMVAVARQRGIEVVLATFAHNSAFLQQPRVSTPEYQGAFGEMNAAIARAAQAAGAHLYDFAAEFPDDPVLFTDGRHVNERGSRLKGRLFAVYLRDEGLVP